METLTGQDFREILARMADLMDREKESLGELDGVIGDGDLGLTMSRGFRAVTETLADLPEADVGKLLGKAGMALSSAVPSTMGTLLATGFLRAGKAALGKTEVTLTELAVMLHDFVEGVMARGKAQPGDKTLIDSLQPAAVALEAAAAGGRTLAEGLAQAFQASVTGLEATKGMVSQHGKAACFQEQTLGKQDPGATVGMWLMKAFVDQVA